ncbi:MAG: CRISPR-associated endonuclease Cas2 [Magnetococcales bacterium]|nr:CRISPR-associated endonuclease Cas2 [Magnetococcales bacterium]
MRYVICYDITENKRRRKLSDCLDNFGDRVQESVFEAVLDGDLYQEMVAEVTKRIKEKEDRVHIHPLCEKCAGKSLRLGVKTDIPGTQTVFVV